MIEDRIVPDNNHGSIEVAAPEKQISREIDDVLKNVGVDSNSNGLGGMVDNGHAEEAV